MDSFPEIFGGGLQPSFKFVFLAHNQGEIQISFIRARTLFKYINCKSKRYA